MATQVQLRRGTTTEHSSFTGAVAELTVDTDKETVVVHDGATAGGHPLARQDLSNATAASTTTAGKVQLTDSISSTSTTTAATPNSVKTAYDQATASRDRSTHTGTQSASTITGLATVATTGAYADLTGKPTIPAAADAPPLALGAAAAIGTSTDYAREDHVHARPSASDIGAAASGAITGSGLTMATARLLGRTTASTGAVEEISVGSGLSLSGGTLSATGGGGGGLTHFVESENTTSPNATVPVDALTATDASYTNIDVAIVPKGSGALLAQVPDGTTAGGNKRGSYATDLQKSRSAATNVASGNYSTILGGANNTASSTYSFIGGGQSNTAQTNTHATVCGGQSNTASESWSSVGGGYGNTASGNSSCVAGGNTNTAFGVCSFIGGGINNAASGSHSAILGGRAGTTRSIAGYQVFPACVIPIASTQGVTQSALLLLGRQTTNATATVLTSDPNAAGTTNQVILPNDSAYSFSGEVIAGVTGAGDTARWTINGAIKRGASAATTAMVGTPTVTMTHNDAGAAAWVVNVTADTTNGGIKVEVTGAASTTIRWVCKITTTEMTF